MKKKVLIIGLDGGESKVIEQITKDFELKNIQRLTSQGHSGALNSTIPANTPTAWSSFQTGMNPGQTGVFDFSYWDRKKQDTGIINSSHLSATLWQRLSRAGLRVGVVNVPMTYPPKKINGELVSGLLTPSLESNFTYPEKLKKEIRQKFPKYHIFNLKGIKKIDPHKNLDGFLKRMRDIIKNRYQLASYLISKNEYDLFMVHFQATDVVQHALWPYLFKGNSKQKKKIIKEFYQYLDHLIGKLIKDFSDNQGVDPLIIILSDHGFEEHKQRFELGQWLVNKGYTAKNPWFFRKRIRKFYKRYWRPLLVKAKIINNQSKDPMSSWFIWQKSKVFSVGRSGEGFIYLLDQKIKKELISELKSIVDPKTKQEVIKKIWLKKELYQGDKINYLPDLILEPNSGYSFSGTPDHKDMFHLVNKNDDFHLGKHRQQGIYVFAGPGVITGQSTASIIDIAPTVLYYLDVSKDNKLDGKIIRKAVE